MGATYASRSTGLLEVHCKPRIQQAGVSACPLVKVVRLLPKQKAFTLSPSLLSSRIQLNKSAYQKSVRSPTKMCSAVLVEETWQNMGREIRKKKLIKVCGITSAQDATIAAKAGADLIGMIMWPGSKRYVTGEQAAQISAAAKANGAEPVAVFVDEDAADIIKLCGLADISIAQLHGDAAREALGDLPPSLKVVYVLQADKSGTIRTPLPCLQKSANEAENTSLPEEENGIESSNEAAELRIEQGARENGSPGSREPISQTAIVEWLLVDGVSAGSGETYDWSNLRLPQQLSRKGWLLAGGLDPSNVAAALGAANPDGVDVASGVAGIDKIKKDKAKVEAFVQAVRLSAVLGVKAEARGTTVVL